MSPFDPPPPRPLSPSVLVVTDDPARRDRVCDALLDLAPAAQLTWARHTLDAMRRSFGMRLHLAVVDWAIDGTGGEALVRHLARQRPEAAVLAFGEAPRRCGGLRVADWPALPAELDRWLLRYRAWVASTLGEGLH